VAVKTHLLVTNDFPPKVGGIQSYLWELWRRLDPTTTSVLTARSHRAWRDFDVEQLESGLRIDRVPRRLAYFPTPQLARRVREACEELDVDLIFFDPVWPLGLLGPHLDLPYGVFLHGAEVTPLARIPGIRRSLASVLVHAAVVISAGGFAGSEAQRLVGRSLRLVNLPPGVDCNRFVPFDASARAQARLKLGLPPSGPLVVSVSRLVPRKGMDVLIEATSSLTRKYPDLTVAIAGDGRDRGRLSRLIAKLSAPVRLLGQVSEDQKAALLGCGDVFVLPCRSRWGGLEQEGFGIVFLEAAACGTPQIAGDSGGASEAVADGKTGIVLEHPTDVVEVASAMERLLADDGLRRKMGLDARSRAVEGFDHGLLAPRLAEVLAQVGG
jgi:phosphatidyl-myo-inositol dimannoside synthase